MTAPGTTTPAPESTRAPASAASARRLAATAVVAVAVNVALALGLRAATDTSSDFLPFQPGPVATATLVGLLAGWALHRVLRRFVRRPDPVFVGVVVVGALLSLGGTLSLLGASPADQPGVTDAAALALIPLHLVPAAALLFAVLGPRRGSRPAR